MSSNDTWAKLGAGVHPSKLDPDHLATHTMAHGVRDVPSGINDPMGTPFDSTAWETTVPDPRSLTGREQLFDMGDVVTHAATGKHYGILDTPSGGVVLEQSGMPAYIYRRIDGTDPRKWVRPQGEMEDGRFRLYQRLRTRA